MKKVLRFVPALLLPVSGSSSFDAEHARVFAEEVPGDDLVSDLERRVDPHSGAACPDPARFSLARPDPPGKPTLVAAGVFFQDVAQLSDVEQTLDADVYVVARWRDPRLAEPARGEGSADCPVPEGRLWMQDLLLTLAGGAVPQLQPHHGAEVGGARSQRGIDSRADGAVAVGPQEVDPTRTCRPGPSLSPAGAGAAAPPWSRGRAASRRAWRAPPSGAAG